MIKACQKNSSINNKIDKVIYYLKMNDYDAAINNIKEAMVEDLSSGKIHIMKSMEILIEQESIIELLVIWNRILLLQ